MNDLNCFYSKGEVADSDLWKVDLSISTVERLPKGKNSKVYKELCDLKDHLIKARRIFRNLTNESVIYDIEKSLSGVKTEKELIDTIETYETSNKR